jgi:GNAT superfamily N-acetyltransferase
MALRIEPLPPAAARAERAGLEALYYAAFSPPPYAESLAEAEAFGTLVERDSRRPGFDGFVVRDDADAILGIVYGYDTPRRAPEGAWWARLLGAVGHRAAREWVLGQFAFCWFAVHPDAQGQGMGAALYDAVLAGVQTPRAWLVTHGDGSRAREMYDRRGWQELARAELGWVPGERAVLGLRVGDR